MEEAQKKVDNEPLRGAWSDHTPLGFGDFLCRFCSGYPWLVALQQSQLPFNQKTINLC